MIRQYLMAFAGGAALVALSVAPVAAAPIGITFAPDGSGAGSTITAINLNGGNGLALGLTGGSSVGATGTFLFQATMGEGTNGSTPVFGSCLPGAQCFTVVAGLTEKISSIAFTPATGSNPGQEAINFSFVAGGTNFFDIYANSTSQANNETGSCFVGTSAGAGGLGCTANTLVLAGSFLNDGSFSSAFDVTLTCPCPPGTSPVTGALDQFDSPNPYPGVSTVEGNGSFQGDIDTFTTINSAFFPAGLPAGIFFSASSKEVLPYDQTSPSACFSSNGTTGGATSAFAGTATTCTNQVGVGSVGSINGSSGPNTMLETEAQLAFDATPAPVPEPMSLTLLGFGLVSAAAARRRQLRNSKKNAE